MALRLSLPLLAIHLCLISCIGDVQVPWKQFKHETAKLESVESEAHDDKNISTPKPFESRSVHDVENPLEDMDKEIESYYNKTLPALCEEIDAAGGVEEYKKYMEDTEMKDPNPVNYDKALKMLPLILPCCSGPKNICSKDQLKTIYRKLHQSAGQRLRHSRFQISIAIVCVCVNFLRLL